jgi:hypothetical protein
MVNFIPAVSMTVEAYKTEMEKYKELFPRDWD